jgi:hypothetical protein
MVQAASVPLLVKEGLGGERASLDPHETRRASVEVEGLREPARVGEIETDGTQGLTLAPAASGSEKARG